MKTSRQPRNKGVALVLVMMTLALMAVLAVEIIFASRVDLRIGRNARDRVQASYLAQSSLRFSLLRLYLYREAKNTFDSAGAAATGAPAAQIVDKIWSMPLPNLPLPGMEVNWPGETMGRIESEGSKIPINLLDGNRHRGSGKTQVEDVRKQIEALIAGLLEDESFDKQYRGLEAKDLIDPLQDWVDADSDKIGGGDENADYERLKPPYTPRNDRLPTLSELHMVRGWTDDLIRRMGSSFSVLNTSLEVNANYISRDRLRALCPKLSNEELAFIERRRFETPFGSMSELAGLITNSPDIPNGRNCKLGELKDKKRETIFIIDGTGVVGEARRTLKLGVKILEEKPKNQPTQPGQSTSSTQSPGAGDPNDPKNDPSKTKLLDPVILTIEEGA